MAQFLELFSGPFELYLEPGDKEMMKTIRDASLNEMSVLYRRLLIQFPAVCCRVDLMKTLKAKM